jgi:hypothetical protein
MKITTSDGITITGFPKLRSIVQELRKTSIIQNITRFSKAVPVVYNSALATDCLPKLLNEMMMCRLEGNIYSGDSSVFTEKFGKSLVCFLDCFDFWLRHPKSVRITALIVQKSLRWIGSVMKVVGGNLRSKEIYIQNLVRKLQNKGVY